MQTYPMPTQAVILAGGLGTRLRSVVRDVPKPMAAIGERPFLSYLLDECVRYGIRDAILAVGYLHETIQQYFGDAYKGMRLRYAIEDEPLGTGGAVKQALRYCPPDMPAFVLNGDTLFATDWQQLYQCYIQQGADIAISLRTMHHFDRYGVVETDSTGRVTAFCEKQYREIGNINGGIYVLSPLLLCNYPDRFSLEQDVLSVSIQHYRLYTHVSESYFIDIGIPDDYRRAQTELPQLFE